MSAPELKIEVLDAARAGDGHALSRLLQTLMPWLRNRARYHRVALQAPVGISTLSQETSLRFSRRIASVRATSSPQVLALLDTIMKNIAKDARRDALADKRGVGATAGVVDEAILDAKTVDQPPQLQHVIHAELHEVLKAALSGLPERQRRALWLHSEGMSPIEIAAQLQCTPAAASMLVQRAKCEAREALAALGMLGTC